MLDRPNALTVTTSDHAAIAAKALLHFSVIRPYLTDHNGRPNPDIVRLGDPTFDGHPNGKPSYYYGPRISGLRGPCVWDTGTWTNLGPPYAEGADIIALVAWLGQCSREVAAEWLGSLCARIVRVEIERAV